MQNMSFELYFKILHDIFYKIIKPKEKHDNHIAYVAHTNTE